MATKKKTKAKNDSKKKMKRSSPKKPSVKKRTKAGKSSKKPAAKKLSRRKAPAKKKTVTRKTAVANKNVRPAKSSETSQPFLRDPRRSRLGEASGDSQGLSRRESADSESVDELLDEGNAFEASVVQGVEEAGDDAEREVRTHEVSEDDVPEEYLDSDK